MARGNRDRWLTIKCRACGVLESVRVRAYYVDHKLVLEAAYLKIVSPGTPTLNR